MTRHPDLREDEWENFVSAITVESLGEEKDVNETTLHSNNAEDEVLEWSVILESNGTNINYKLDTGSQVNILPKKEYTKLIHTPKLHPAKVKLTSYNGTDMPVVCKCIVTLKNGYQEYKVLFIVAEMDSVPLVGLNTCKKLNLINRLTVDCEYSSLINEYSDCFGEIGSLSKVHHLTIDGNFSPVIQAPRKVPFALREKLKDELDRMMRLGIIDKVDGPTDWVSNLVIVEKPNGKLCVCLDPRDLNQAIKRQHYQLPTAKDILSQMAGAKYFSKLDASSGYWQLKFDEQSSKLLAFHTPFGRYKFKRLPFGVNCASEIFQAEVTEILEGLEGCANAQDDIVVWGDTKDNHDRRLKNVLSRIRFSGYKLNRSKCIFGSNQITYLGQLLTSEGVKADSQKVSAILSMPAPENRSDLQRFLGMVTYLGKFVPNLSEVSAPLRVLLEKDIVWSFDTPQQQAFQELKLIITNAPVLKYFDPKLPIKVSSDASKSGLGATLEQKHGDNWYPVAFASRSMTSSGTNYVQIEKEILSTVFACEHFNAFLYGQRFLVENDHKPLKDIFQKPVLKSPPRIQRFLLRLQKYQFTTNYIPGKDMVVTDTLSRAYLSNTSTPEIDTSDMTRYVRFLISNLPISDDKLLQFQRETSRDPALEKLRGYTEKGWPQEKKDVDSLVHSLILSCTFSCTTNIAMKSLLQINGLLLRNERIIVPTTMRQEMRTKIHAGHLKKKKFSFGQACQLK